MNGGNRMEFLQNFSLEGKVALITGASYGIGFAIATAYAKAGATIVFNDIKQELVDKGLAAYKEEGIEAHGYVCDVTNEEAVQTMVKKIEEEVGVIDILVNNAGIIKRIPMTEMTADQFRQVIDVDLNAPFIVSKAVIPSMIKKGHGKIINICSMMSELGRETVSAYAAAKGGLKMLTRNIASEYGEFNIQCNGIGPGYIATPQTAPLREIQPEALPINFLLPIPGTPLGDADISELTTEYCMKVLCLARLLVPQSDIRCAAGREVYFKGEEKKLLSVVDSIFASGYLTADGQGIKDTIRTITDAGFTYEIESA